MKRIRRLFAPTPLSPAMERFLGWLGETPYHWYVSPNGKLRALERGAELCAVTGVARYRDGAVFGPGDWARAAAAIGLSYAEAALIVTAADAAGPAHGPVLRLRDRLLLAARIGSASATTPSRPDATDRALTELWRARADAFDRPPGDRHVEQEDPLAA